MNEMGFEVHKVQQKIDTQLPLPLLGTILPESHPCVCATLRVFVTAVTHRQVESQDRGQLDIERALVRCSLGPCVHLATQYHHIQQLAIAVNG